MPTVVSVRLRNAAKALWFDPGELEPGAGAHVVVRTDLGEEIGEVTEAAHVVEDAPAPLKPVLRLATDVDLSEAARLQDTERGALAAFRELAQSRGLDMKPIDVEYSFDGSRAVFYYVAEERVDFRELVRDLGARLKVRVDMRQVGVRDEARMVGGVGHCGQMLCCVRFGGEFQPVSIRMAKEQDLPLNPLKISGSCGRLMCCLRYEYDAYKDFKQRAPKRGAMVATPQGEAKVVELNTPREVVTLRFADGGQVKVPLGSMECGKGGACPCAVGAEALEAARGGPSTLVAAAAAAAAPVAEPAESAESAPAERKKRRPRRSGGGGGGERRTEPKNAAPAGPPAERGASATQPQGTPGGEQPSQPSRRRRRRRPRGGGGGGTGGGGGGGGTGAGGGGGAPAQGV